MKPLAPNPPTLDELRQLWLRRTPEIEDLRRLIPEVQHARIRLDEVRALLAEHDKKLRHLGLDDLREKHSPFQRAERLALRETERIGTIDDAPKRPEPGAHATPDTLRNLKRGYFRQCRCLSSERTAPSSLR
ncbi:MULTISPECIES: hypothetical protein [unclassified Caballeronia]|uniref:hypothetical protein n=1 Tax=unclassified Caballeronia TaxID=2646786 RepID=UPI002860661A|nr:MULTISPECIES: hypothetical protein [unclassified Caballeronia]MDR5775601.1 hypothetical protein [Caballeronia sp. LZ002]MDR5802304.1 hypothetical protein [Caballeronia sp. LZ001]MDR5851039.1 hypothetical protein [Caballeronia sp. LZ003]